VHRDAFLWHTAAKFDRTHGICNGNLNLKSLHRAVCLSRTFSSSQDARTQRNSVVEFDMNDTGHDCELPLGVNAVCSL
jgi:hypothetical protein